VQRLGKNHGGYHGERIDIASVLRDIADAAQCHGWTGEPLTAEAGLELQTWTRSPAAPRRRLYLSAGIHGDEPAGPLAVLQLLQENVFPADLGVWLCPCLNPGGFAVNTRENAAGLDLNRQYLNPEAVETRAHIAWLERQPSFDTAVCLHEDWESHGFYLYELNPDDLPSQADEILRRVSAVCPIDHSEMIENRPASAGLIRPSTDPRSRPDWPEAFWLFTHRTRHSYTMEAPSDFPLATRVAALVESVRVMLERP
jgi:murein peptide amidase A